VHARSFALTKIQPPRGRPGLVGRERLEGALARALAEARLVLISAPAGFGKTTLLTRQVANLEPSTALAWIAADEDDDLSRLAACCVAALEPYDLPWRTSPDAVVRALDGATPQRRKEVAGDFINTLVATDVPRGLIVVDDAHRIQDPTVFGFLDHLVERLPAHWGIVIATRVDPPMALARLRARGELAEFRQEDLRFTEDEVEALVEAAPAGAARGTSPAQLLQRTQGWAAGLGLALNSRRAHGAVTERHVYDYLAAEVLTGMPADLRRFLLRCSVLPELEAERCIAVSGDARAPQWLAEIERRGLFVSLRGEGAQAVLTLHDLFRDCLDDLLRRDHPEELTGLLERAAASEPDTVRRVHYLLRAGDYASARAVVVEHGPTMIIGGAIGALLRLLEQFPPAERDSPALEALRGYAGWARWDFDTMRRSMHRAAQGFARAGHDAGRRFAEVHEALALVASYANDDAQVLIDRLESGPIEPEIEPLVLHARICQATERGPMEAIAQLYARELDVVAQRPSLVAWYKAVPTTRFLGLPGMRGPLLRCVAAAQAAATGSSTALGVVARAMEAWVHAWAGALDEAERVMAVAADDARWLDQSRALSTPLQLCTAFVQALRGDGAAASAALQAILDNLAAEPVALRRQSLTAMFLFVDLRIAAATGMPPAVLAAAARLAALPEPEAGRPSAIERRLAAAYVAEAEGQHAAALAAWREGVAHEGLLRTFGLDLEVRLRAAAAMVRAGESLDEAASWVRTVIARARQGQEHLPALLAGEPVLDRLAAAPWAGRLAADELRQLGEWRRTAAALRTAPGAASSGALATSTMPRAPSMNPAAIPSVHRTAPEHTAAAQVATAQVSAPHLASPNGAPACAARPAAAPITLSEREREVLARLAAGDSNKLIARAFDLSPHTVKRHVANILDKLDLTSRGQAAAWFREHGAGP
jgi:LuxR family maltose regulon positive regulatory protein